MSRISRLATSSDLTPHSNTGSSTQISEGSTIEASLDYLTVVGHFDAPETLRALIWAAFGQHLNQHANPIFRGKSYQYYESNEMGIELCYNPTVPYASGYDYRLSVPGKPLSDIDALRIMDFGRALYGMGAKCTRFDWAMDFKGEDAAIFNMGEIVGAARTGNYSGAKSAKIISTYNRLLPFFDGETKGCTVYFGSKSSDKLVRIYDKGYQMKMEEPWVRYEVQWRDEQAHERFTILFGDDSHSDVVPEHYYRHMSRVALGAITFLHRSDNPSRPERCRRLGFWEWVLEQVGNGIRVKVPRLVATIEDKKDWIEKQVAPTLALIMCKSGAQRGSHWLADIISSAVDKLSDEKITILRNVKDRMVVRHKSMKHRVKSYYDYCEYYDLAYK